MINYKKLLKQEPAFAEFAKSATFDILIKADPGFINILFSFYQAGLTVEQTVNAMSAFMKIHESL